MRGLPDQAGVIVHSLRTEPRACVVHQLLNHPWALSVARNPLRRQRIEGQYLGRRREHPTGHSGNGQPGWVQPDQGGGVRGRLALMLQHPLRGHRTTSRMAGHRMRLHIQFAQQIVQRPRHLAQAGPKVICDVAERMAGQVRANHGEIRAEQRRQIPPGMGGRARAVQQQQHRPATRNLYMPAHARRLHKAAAVHVRPVRPQVRGLHRRV